MIFGSPWTHEGLLAIAGYIGIFLASKKQGMFQALEDSFDLVIVVSFVACILQLKYGSIIYAPFIHWAMPDMTYQTIDWPLYSVYGNSNNLGLFCALFFPYAFDRKKPILLIMIIFMLVTCQSRGAWAAVFITALLMGRKTFLFTALVCIILAVPFYKKTIHRISTNMVHFPLRDSDLSGRGYMWKESLPLMVRTILIGKGPGTFGLHFPQHQKRGDDLGFFNAVVDRPHNMYINVWVTLGGSILIALLMGLSKIIINGEDAGLVMGCIGFLLCGLTTDSVLSVTPYFMIFLGALAHRGET